MTTIDPFDLESVQLCLQGKRDCYEPLVKKYGSNVLALAMNLLGNYDDALDVMQEAFVQAYVNLERFDRQRSFKTWVLSIAVKRCMDLFRKQKRFLQYFNHHANQFQYRQEQACNGNTYLEDSPLFFPLLKRLKKKERAALVLKVNENYTAKEIGEILNCSESTARVHLFNAKQKLKQWLTPSEKNGEEIQPASSRR